ncbi:MAG TPA: glycosyltransferase family 4 protein [Allosphingosinicella sp.]|jgi:Fuc2NAc and GlcNAc transferase
MSDWLLLAVLAALVFGASAGGTLVLRNYALRRDLLDRPNERSSHEAPTPRGGGVAIVLSTLAALAALAVAGAVPIEVAVGIGGGGLIVAAIGFWDDHGHIAARWRLLAHFAATAWLLAWLGGVPDVFALGDAPLLRGAIVALAAVGIVWLINLYNFMDGIDGIASVEAITVALGGIAAAAAAGLAGEAALPPLLIASVAGFLAWNWPPARIFMGDAGSGFLGAVLAGLALAAGHARPALLYAWLILIGLFVVDASVTVIRRALRGERIYEAHRSHAYQRASRRYGSHLPVTLAVGALNLLWLAPIAVAAAAERIGGPLAIALAYAPLILLALLLRAGAEDAPAKKY